MRNALSRMNRLFAIVATLALVALAATPALADKVHTKDGRVLEGEIVRESSSFVTIRVKVGDEEKDITLFMSEVASVERTADEAPAPKDEPAKADPKPANPQAAAAPSNNKPAEQPKARSSSAGATKIAFITLGDTKNGKDMVGPYVYADAIRSSLKILDELPEDQKPEIVVLWVDSGGGALVELEPLNRLVQYEMKPKYRTVAWIRSAISAAAMTSWPCEELIMMTNAPIGACTAWSGNLQKMDGPALGELLKHMREVSRWGKKDPLIMQAMQVCEPDFPRNDLSADIDEHGNVTWYDGPEGQYMVCKKTDILTFNSIDAVKFGLAKGIADTKDEVAALLGCKEWIEVGPEANDYQVRFRDNLKLSETKLGELLQKINIALQFAQGAQTEQERNAQVGRALNYLRQMRAMVRKSPSLEFYEQWTKERFDAMEEQIKANRAR
ncbi:MAG: hypothetical protein R3B46_07150 [Phycisphaerales bacterium]|nr:hypothetical protein [Phycisphaerales bacterium]